MPSPLPSSPRLPSSVAAVMAHLAPCVPWPAPALHTKPPDAIRTPASSVPPSLLPHPASRFQEVLRSTSRHSPTNAAPGSYFVRSTRENDGKMDEGLDALEELSWEGSRVVWSRGGSVFRTFSYEEKGETVTQALFADFYVPAEPAYNPSAASPTASTSAQRLDNDFSSSLFGPYRKPVTSSWSDDPLPLPVDPTDPGPAPQTRLDRTLIVLLSTIAFAYPSKGGCIPFPLPFRVERAWPLDHGILLERKREGREVWAENVGAQLPTLYTLSDLCDEMKAVAVVPSFRCTSGREEVEVETDGPIIPVEDLDEKVVFVSTMERAGEPPVAVSMNEKTRKVSIWAYGRLKAKLEGEEVVANGPVLAELDPKGEGKAVARDGGEETNGATSVGMSRGRGSLSGTKRKLADTSAHSASMPEERSIRRASGQYVGSSKGRPRLSISRVIDQEDELLEALSHNAEPLKPPPNATSSAALRRPATIDRRTSMTRNDLSVTMDRMALSQGASSAGGGDLEREATIFFSEAEQTSAASEVVLQRLWDADLGNLDTKGISAYLFDTRSPETSSLAIVLPAAHVLLILQLSTASDGSVTVSPLREVQASSATTVLATRSAVLDLAYLRPDGTLAVVTADGREDNADLSPLAADDRPAKLAGDASRRMVIVTEQQKRVMTCFPLPSCRLLRDCLEALSAVLPLDDFVQLRASVLRRRGASGADSGLQDLEAVLAPLFGIDAAAAGVAPDPFEAFQRRRADHQPAFPLRASATIHHSATFANSPSPDLPDQLQATLLTFHLVVQDVRLSARRRKDVVKLGRLVARLAGAAGLSGWVDYYRRLLGAALEPVQIAPGHTASRLPSTPPDLLTHLAALFRSEPRPTTHFDLASIAENFSLVPSGFYGSAVVPNRLTSAIIRLYSLLSDGSAGRPAPRIHSAVRYMLDELHWTAEDLDGLTFAVVLPLCEAIRSCQLDPPDNWPVEAYNLIRRTDLARQHGASQRTAPASRSQPAAIAASIDELAQRVAGLPTSSAGSASPTSTNASLNPVPRAARFNEDKRLEEVTRMLQFEDPVTISAGDRTIDQLTPQIQQSVLLALSQRTLSLPVGWGIFRFRTKTLHPSDAIKIGKINTAARIVPMPSPVALVEKEREPTAGAPPDRFEWPDFHAGVSAALELQLDGGQAVDSSQISFNRPADLDSRHAGLLYGLGLSGQLGSMLSSQAYDYLKSKHDPTSVGILLGLAASYLATGDATVTSVISIHLPALHPPRSSSLNVSGMTQAAAAVALGLVHFGSARRNYADVLLRELCGIKVTSIDDGSQCREAYALSAGFSFGLIMLSAGRRDKTRSSKEVDHLRVFRALILGESNNALPGAQSAKNVTDVNVTSPAATVAVGLTYLRSERKDVAEMLEIPSTPRNLDYVRPDLLLLRTICRNLILWDQVAKSKEWVESQLLPFLGGEAAASAKTPDADHDIARWSIAAGACFAMGLKFAGTAAADAHATLIHYLDRLSRASYVKTSSIQGKMKRQALRASLAALSLALSMVMAGTGEINVLRRIRVAHGLFSDGITYGSHLAVHMSLGLLFLGQGKQTLGNFDAAVAALFLSLYPIFPSTSIENRFHLQAYRHLWVLAVEPRYLEARDVDSGEPVFLPVRLRLKPDGVSGQPSGKAAVKQLVAPTLIPSISQIDAIQIDSPRYWAFALNLSSNPSHLEQFLRDSTLYVKRKTGHLSYAQDPRGIRSIFTRSKSETGSSVFDFGQTARMLSTSANGLRDFVAAFSGDEEAVAATAALCLPKDASRPPTEFEAFSASVLLECLTKDKRDVAPIYRAVYSAIKDLEAALNSPSSNSSSTALLETDDLRFVIEFYKLGAFKSIFSRVGAPGPSSSSSKSKSGSSTSREPLLHPSFISHLSSTLSALGSGAVSGGGSNVFERYLRELGEWPTDSHLSTRLSLALSHLRLPSLPTLSQLRDLVRQAQQNQGASKEVVEVLLRATAKKVEETRGRGTAWTEEGERRMVESWCGGA
ncbi:anaphase promoting complex subunit 1 [Rhodotorula toruloides]|uniref:Anaphase promoting complex subunit 1 n=1 Tax=Rhodotorula toruloides TaxID=5286 RepID=A0A2S9ZYZ1_RHOTO|nr:anaphase promoting complex subunit 1 [Rhodotorula toruloides]